MHEAASGSSLRAELLGAIDDYQSHWQSVDTELYDLCRRRAHQSFADVYAKVVVINRVYAAGISRSSRAQGDRESEVARGLVSLGPALEERLTRLRTASELDAATAADVVEVHDFLVRGLLPFTGDTWQTSFGSKYLHFHWNLVPIFDDRAGSAIRRVLMKHGVSPMRVETSKPQTWVTAYRNFVEQFLALYESLREGEPESNCQMLWTRSHAAAPSSVPSSLLSRS